MLGASSSEEQEEEEGDVEESLQGENEGVEDISPIYNHLGTILNPNSNWGGGGRSHQARQNFEKVPVFAQL